jgi:hypothetical protein
MNTDVPTISGIVDKIGLDNQCVPSCGPHSCSFPNDPGSSSSASAAIPSTARNSLSRLWPRKVNFDDAMMRVTFTDGRVAQPAARVAAGVAEGDARAAGAL